MWLVTLEEKAHEFCYVENDKIIIWSAYKWGKYDK